MKKFLLILLLVSCPAYATESTYEYKTEKYNFYCTKIEKKDHETHGCSDTRTGYTHTLFFDKKNKTCEWKDSYGNRTLTKCDKTNDKP